MSAFRELPPVSYLKDLFEIKEDTLYWKVNKGKYKAGAKAGYRSPSDGYIYVSIDYKRYSAHRVVYAMTHKITSFGTLDHIDGVRINNSPSNLREVTQVQNRMNETRARKTITGVPGVYILRGVKRPSWYAQIKVGEERLHLGTYYSVEEAAAARRDAELKYFGQYAPIKERY